MEQLSELERRISKLSNFMMTTRERRNCNHANTDEHLDNSNSLPNNPVMV